MGRVIAIANQQSGTGKTSTAINLSACLALLGRKVLLIDADAQANATARLDSKGCSNAGNSLHQVLRAGITAREAIFDTEISNLRMIGSDINLIGAEFDFLELPGRNMMLKRSIAPVRDDFDFIIIDCGPSLGILTLNALAAADSVMIPIQPEFFALDGIGKLLQTVRLLQSSENSGLEVEGFLISLFDGRSKMHSQVVEEIRGMFSDMIFETAILRSEKVSEAEMRRMPVVLYDPRSTSAANYTRLAQELIDKDRK